MSRSSFGSVLFITMAAKSVGHRYRVINHAEAFERLGLRTCIADATQADVALAILHDLSVVIIFRPILT